ncbi:AraC family transcriptional regulator [Paenibacillus marinisediminis]
MSKPQRTTNHGNGYISERIGAAWKRKWIDRIWLRFLLPYLLFLGLTLFTGWLAYHSTIDALEQEVLNRNAKTLQQAQVLLDARLNEVESIVQQTVEHPKVKGFQVVREPFKGTNMFKVMSTRSALSDYSASNKFLLDYFIAFKNSRLIISPDRVHLIDTFYDDVLKVEGWTRDEWEQKILNSYHSRDYYGAVEMKYGINKEPMIAYVRSLGYPGYYPGAVVALIPHKEIEKLLPVQHGGWIQIVGENQQVIGSSGTLPAREETALLISKLANEREQFRTRVVGEEMLVSQIVSPKTGWTFVAAQPTAEVLKSVEEMKQTTFTLVGLSLALILLLAYWFSRKNSRPLERLYADVLPLTKPSLPGKRKDVFTSLRDVYSELLETTKTLNRKLAERQEYARLAVFGKWLRGGYASDQQLQASLEHAGLDRRASRYAVALLQLGWHGDDWSPSVLHEMELKRLQVLDEAGSFGLVPYDAIDIEQDQVALLFYDMSTPDSGAADEAFDSGISLTLIELSERLKQQHVTLICSVGGIVTERLDVPRALEQARQLAASAERETDKAILWWDEQSVLLYSLYSYSADTEQRLVHAIRAGNENNTAQLFQTIWTDNWSKLEISSVMKQWLLMDVYATLLKQSIALDIPLKQDPVHFQQQLMKTGGGLTKLFRLIEAEAFHLCHEVNERKRSRNENLLDEMMRYIHDHIADPSLSLTAIADELQVSEAYVSAFFKEQCGINFFDYVERFRLSAAKEMMKNGAPLTSIAEQVGYNSLNSFSRAFKRVHGTSATEYRKMHSP